MRKRTSVILRFSNFFTACGGRGTQGGETVRAPVVEAWGKCVRGAGQAVLAPGGPWNPRNASGVDSMAVIRLVARRRAGKGSRAGGTRGTVGGGDATNAPAGATQRPARCARRGGFFPIGATGNGHERSPTAPRPGSGSAGAAPSTSPARARETLWSTVSPPYTMKRKRKIGTDANSGQFGAGGGQWDPSRHPSTFGANVPPCRRYWGCTMERTMPQKRVVGRQT